MYAAVVTEFGAPPRYGEFAEPEAVGAGERLVDVLAAALHPRVRSQADGSHYTSTDELPLVPGVDAVVRDPAGRLFYTVIDNPTFGTMAERTVITQARSVRLPDGADPVVVAAATNPVMSSWIALRRRIEFRPGHGVLVLGATGAAGRTAVQVARRFGASRVLAAGRNPDRLAPLRALGADETLTFEQLDVAADVDVVLDYVWGGRTASAMVDIITARSDRARPLSWIEIGSVAGGNATIASAALRSSRLQIVGSGIGSVPGAEIVAELPDLTAAVAEGGFAVRPKVVPLRDVERAWTDTLDPDERIVFVP